MKDAQLNVRIPAELLQRLRQAAEASKRSTSSLALEWIEAGLATGPAVDSNATHDRLALLDARVAALEAATTPRARQATPTPVAAPLAAPGGDRREPPTDGETLTTAEVMDLTGTTGRRTTWTAWAGRHAPGDVRVCNGFRIELVGKVPPPAGGPDRLMWKAL